MRSKDEEGYSENIVIKRIDPQETALEKEKIT